MHFLELEVLKRGEKEVSITHEPYKRREGCVDNVRDGSFALSLCSVKLLAGNVGAEQQAGLYG